MTTIPTPSAVEALKEASEALLSFARLGASLPEQYEPGHSRHQYEINPADIWRAREAYDGLKKALAAALEQGEGEKDAAQSTLAPGNPDDDALVFRRDVVAMLKRVADEHADLAVYGLPENARGREAMEAALRRAQYAVAFMPTAPTPAGASWTEAVAKAADEIVRDACELTDRTSPEDWPEALLITGQELHDLITGRFATLNAAPAAGGVGWKPAHDDIADCVWEAVNEARTSKVIAESSAIFRRELLRDVVRDCVDAILALSPAAAPAQPEPTEPDYYPSHEALHDLVSLLSEHDALNGGGPGWNERWKKAVLAAEELVRVEP